MLETAPANLPCNSAGFLECLEMLIIPRTLRALSEILYWPMRIPPYATTDGLAKRSAWSGGGCPFSDTNVQFRIGQRLFQSTPSALSAMFLNTYRSADDGISVATLQPNGHRSTRVQDSETTSPGDHRGRGSFRRGRSLGRSFAAEACGADGGARHRVDRHGEARSDAAPGARAGVAGAEPGIGAPDSGGDRSHRRSHSYAARLAGDRRAPSCWR